MVIGPQCQTGIVFKVCVLSISDCHNYQCPSSSGKEPTGYSSSQNSAVLTTSYLQSLLPCPNTFFPSWYLPTHRAVNDKREDFKPFALIQIFLLVIPSFPSNLKHASTASDMITETSKTYKHRNLFCIHSPLWSNRKPMKHDIFSIYKHASFSNSSRKTLLQERK